MQLRDYQERVIQDIRRAIGSGRKRIVVQLPTGAGKCLGIGTPVLMYDGTTQRVETIKVGDRLIGPDGQQRGVTSVCRGRGPLYRITPNKGDPWVCNDVHVLTLVETQSNTVIDIPVNQYLLKNRTFKHTHKLFRPDHPISFEPCPLPAIDAYFLGLWIGDGTKALNGVAISKPDIEVLEACQGVAEAYGLAVRTDGYSCPTHHLVQPERSGGKPNPLLDLLRQYCGDGRFPQEVIGSSEAYRSQFLAGIIDSDGHVAKGGCEVIQKNRAYANGIAKVARSLGFQVSESVKTVDGVGYVRLYISGDMSRVPTRIPRKKLAPRLQKKVATRTGFAIDPIGDGEYAGFTLDGDGRFLLGDFTVTHNTIAAAAIVRMAQAKGNGVIFTVPALQLIDQTVDKFERNGIPSIDIGVMQASHPRTNRACPIQVASVQTLQRRKIPKVKIIILDEVHINFAFYDTWMDDPEFADTIWIGLTATPWAKGMGKRWEHLIIGTTLQELIDQKVLSDFRVFAPGHPDLSGVKIVAGDYEIKGLGGAMNTAPLVADIIKTWEEKGGGRPTLCFAVDRAHAKHLQQQFEAAGVTADYLDAYSDREERAAVETRFSLGYTKVVCNVGVLTTGVDWDVRCIILARPTKSEILYVQIIGRGLRQAEGKDYCLILDHSDTTQRLGFVTDIHHEELDDGKPKGPADKKEPLPKECPKCSFLRPAKVKTCPNCGFTPVLTASAVDTEDGELVELRRVKGAVDPFPKRETFYRELLAHARRRGYQDGWAAHAYKEKYGNWPDHQFQREPAIFPSSETYRWIMSLNIRRAKAREKASR